MNASNVSDILKALFSKRKELLTEQIITLFIFTKYKEFVQHLVSQNKLIELQQSRVCVWLTMTCNQMYRKSQNSIWFWQSLECSIMSYSIMDFTFNAAKIHKCTS